MTVQETLDVIDEMLDSALALPLSGGKCMINADKLRQLIEDIRVNLPREFEEANRIVQDRQRILDDARRRADTEIKKAEEASRRLVEEQEIYKKAKAAGAMILSQAQAQSKDLRIAVNEFAENILKTTEQGLVESLSQVKNARAALKTPPTNKNNG